MWQTHSAFLTNLVSYYANLVCINKYFTPKRKVHSKINYFLGIVKRKIQKIRKCFHFTSFGYVLTSTEKYIHDNESKCRTLTKIFDYNKIENEVPIKGNFGLIIPSWSMSIFCILIKLYSQK